MRVCRLEVGVGQAGQGGVAGGEGGERPQQRGQPAQQQPEPLPHHHQVGIVGDVSAGGSQMDVGPGGRRLVAEGVHVGHHVVPEAPLVLRRRGEVGIVEVGAQLLHRPLGDGDAEGALLFHQREPEPAPEPDPVGLAPELLHGRRGVPGTERRLVPGVAHRRKTRSVKMVCPARSK
jgi:hypothetical protein